MPTPFTHLVIARELLARPELAPGVRAALSAELPAFLFGNIAPDAQTVSRQSREATHFFPVPLGDAPPAHRRLFARHPELAHVRQLPAAQAAFLAGYLAHLALDQLWVSDIFDPVFGERQTWSTFPKRIYLHNALRAYLDADDLRRLPEKVAVSVSAAQPQDWLPFLADKPLRGWRDLVAGQLHTGEVRTAEVFAGRMGADPRAFAALVESPNEMRRRVFSRLPRERLDRYRADGLAMCMQLIEAYWEGTL